MSTCVCVCVCTHMMVVVQWVIFSNMMKGNIYWLPGNVCLLCTCASLYMYMYVTINSC